MDKGIVVKRDSDEVKTLCMNDPQMAKLIKKIEDFTIDLNGDRFKALIQSIIGQQLSVKAAGTISSRLLSLLDYQLNPNSLDRMDDESLRNVGISKQKISYIRDVCEKVQNGELDLQGIDLLNDEQVIGNLTHIKGIGNWTAEMFLIFTLGRENVLSLGDISLQKACKWLYPGEGTTDGRRLMELKGSNWMPYCTFASLYLWEAIDQGLLSKYKDIDEALLTP